MAATNPKYTLANLPLQNAYHQTPLILLRDPNNPTSASFLDIIDYLNVQSTGDVADANPSISTAGGIVTAKGLKVGTTSYLTGATTLNGATTSNSTFTQVGIYTNQNTTDATGVNTGAEQIQGGLSVNKTIYGNGAQILNGIFNSNNTTNATSSTAASMVLAGGVGVGKDIIQASTSSAKFGNTTVEDLVINGSLYELGTGKTVLKSSNTMLADNIVLANGFPSVTGLDVGFAFSMYQPASATLTGDVVTNGATLGYSQYTVTSGTTTTIVLPSTALTAFPTAISMQDAYIALQSGTGSGQVRRVKSWNISTYTITIYGTADIAAQNPVAVPQYAADMTTAPDNTTVVRIYTQGYAELIYSNTLNRFRFGYASPNPTNNILSYLNQLADVDLASLYVNKNLYTANIAALVSGSGLTIETVGFNQGALTNVTSINGRTAIPAPQIVSIADNDVSTLTVITNMLAYGIYDIAVNGQNGAGSLYFTAIRANSTTALWTFGAVTSSVDLAQAKPVVGYNSSNQLVFKHAAAATTPTGNLLTYRIGITPKV